MTLNIIKSTLVLLCIIYQSSVFSARYELTEINEPEISAINNIGTVIGLTSNGSPYVWRRDQTDMSYPAETETSIDERVFRILLPTDFDQDATDFRVLDINAESLDSKGQLTNDNDGTVVGSYLDVRKNRQSVIWYKKMVANKMQYVAFKLAPHKSYATYCKGKQDQYFPLTECIFNVDSDIIYRASRCEANEQWEMPNNIWVSIPGGASAICNESDSLPICEYKLAEIPDGTIITEGENGAADIDTGIEKFIYQFNEKYAAQECILKEHAELVLLARQCDNSSFSNAGDPITIQCDTSSEAIAINNDNAIIGTSYKEDGSGRPIIWLKNEDLDSEGNPVYPSNDLGKLRESNEVDESIERPQEDSKLSPDITISYRNGYPTALSNNAHNAAGMLRLNGPESPPTPVAWFNININDFDLPAPLLAPSSSTITDNPCTPAPPSATSYPSTVVEPKSINNTRIVGSYQDEFLNSRPIMWRECQHTSRVEGKIVRTTTLSSNHILTNQESNIGTALVNNTTEIIGSQQLETQTNGITETNDHAFIHTTRCGPQDLNELLADLITDDSLSLEEAYAIGSGNVTHPLLAKGKSAQGEVKPYILTPKEVFVDLEVRMKPHESSLEVGSQQTISFTVSNNGAVDNVTPANTATCVFFLISSTVYEGATYEDKIKETNDAGITIDSDMKIEFDKLPRIEDELIGGLTFSEFSSSSEEVSCFINQVEMFCALAKLPPNKALTITVRATPRPLLADRTIRTHVSVSSTESEPEDLELNNSDFQLVDIEREGCFIATAAYGSYLMPELKVLRQFRDEVLLKNDIGKHIVEYYYDISPSLATFIAQDESRRAIARFILNPVVYGISNPMTSLFLLLALSVFFITRKYKHREALRKQCNE